MHGLLSRILTSLHLIIESAAVYRFAALRRKKLTVWLSVTATLTVPASAPRRTQSTPHLSLPERHPDYPRYQSLLRLERRLFGDWLQWLTTSWYIYQHPCLLHTPLRKLCRSSCKPVRNRLRFDCTANFDHAMPNATSMC